MAWDAGLIESLPLWGHRWYNVDSEMTCKSAHTLSKLFAFFTVFCGITEVDVVLFLVFSRVSLFSLPKSANWLMYLVMGEPDEEARPSGRMIDKE